MTAVAGCPESSLYTFLEQQAQAALDTPGKIRGIRREVDERITAHYKGFVDPAKREYYTAHTANQVPYGVLSHLMAVKLSADGPLEPPEVDTLAWYKAIDQTYKQTANNVQRQLRDPKNSLRGLLVWQLASRARFERARRDYPIFPGMIYKYCKPSEELGTAWTISPILTRSVLIGHAVRQCIANDGTLPSAQALRQSVRPELAGYGALASMGRWAFHSILFSKEAREEAWARMRESGYWPLEQIRELWIAFAHYLEDPQEHPFNSYDLQSPLMQHAPPDLHVSLANGPWRERRRCSGQLNLRPPDSNDRAVASQACARLGVPNEDGAFRSSDFVIGMEVEWPLFESEQSRSALEALALAVYKARQTRASS